MTRCPALKMAIRTHRQLKRSGSNERQKDHQVHRPRKVKKYTLEVREGNIIPGTRTHREKSFPEPVLQVQWNIVKTCVQKRPMFIFSNRSMYEASAIWKSCSIMWIPIVVTICFALKGIVHPKIKENFSIV